MMSQKQYNNGHLLVRKQEVNNTVLKGILTKKCSFSEFFQLFAFVCLSFSGGTGSSCRGLCGCSCLSGLRSRGGPRSHRTAPDPTTTTPLSWTSCDRTPCGPTPYPTPARSEVRVTRGGDSIGCGRAASRRVRSPRASSPTWAPSRAIGASGTTRNSGDLA